MNYFKTIIANILFYFKQFSNEVVSTPLKYQIYREKGYHIFQGYYGQRVGNTEYIAYNRLKINSDLRDGNDACEIILLDRLNGLTRVVETEYTWNWQLGVLLNFVGDLLVFNGLENNRAVTKFYSLNSGEFRFFDGHYSLFLGKRNLRFVVSYKKLADCNSEYGMYYKYSESIPDDVAFLICDEAKVLLEISYAELIAKAELKGVGVESMFVNHFFADSGENNVSFILRWHDSMGDRNDRLFVLDLEENTLSCIPDVKHISHLHWNGKGGIVCSILKPKISYCVIEKREGNWIKNNFEYARLSYDTHFVFTDECEFYADTYPGYGRKAKLIKVRHDGQKVELLANLQSGRFRGETRCDLHVKQSIHSVTCDIAVNAIERGVIELFE
jgi:hypothetical protein